MLEAILWKIRTFKQNFQAVWKKRVGETHWRGRRPSCARPQAEAYEAEGRDPRRAKPGASLSSRSCLYAPTNICEAEGRAARGRRPRLARPEAEHRVGRSPERPASQSWPEAQGAQHLARWLVILYKAALPLTHLLIAHSSTGNR